MTRHFDYIFDLPTKLEDNSDCILHPYFMSVLCPVPITNSSKIAKSLLWDYNSQTWNVSKAKQDQSKKAKAN